MNLNDFARINMIVGKYQPETPAIKIIDNGNVGNVLVDFKKDLLRINSLDGYRTNCVIYNDYLVDITQNNGQMPVIYYLAMNLFNRECTLIEFEQICDKLDVNIEYRSL